MLTSSLEMLYNTYSLPYILIEKMLLVLHGDSVFERKKKKSRPSLPLYTLDPFQWMVDIFHTTL